MDEKRRFDRWGLGRSAYIDLEGEKSEAQVIDVSIGGMRIITDTPLDRERVVSSEFKILPNVGPFFVKGRIIWTIAKEGAFESGVVFDKVSTAPLG